MTYKRHAAIDSDRIVSNLLNDLNSEKVKMDCGHYVKFNQLSVRSIRKNDQVEIIISCRGCKSQIVETCEEF